MSLGKVLLVWPRCVGKDDNCHHNIAAALNGARLNLCSAGAGSDAPRLQVTRPLMCPRSPLQAAAQAAERTWWAKAPGALPWTRSSTWTASSAWPAAPSCAASPSSPWRKKRTVSRAISWVAFSPHLPRCLLLTRSGFPGKKTLAELQMKIRLLDRAEKQLLKFAFSVEHYLNIRLIGAETCAPCCPKRTPAANDPHFSDIRVTAGTLSNVQSVILVSTWLVNSCSCLQSRSGSTLTGDKARM